MPLIAPTELFINPNIDKNKSVIIGVDEVGRGCLFGQMSVCACILPSEFAVSLHNEQGLPTLSDTPFARLTDSKKLTEKQRLTLSTLIKSHASYALVDISARTIDELNIHNATLLGMHSAIVALTAHYPMASVLIDGVHAPKDLLQVLDIQTIIKGDSVHASIAGASILAKVHRDTAMLDLAKVYPNFGLEKHKGYPTPAHKQALAQFGVLAEHRRSYKPVADILAQVFTQS